jgi:hypothetical protein
MRISPVICAALAVFPAAQAGMARSSLDELTFAPTSGAPGNILPSFVSPGRLGAFLSAVHEAESLPNEGRAAAEEISSRFADDDHRVARAPARLVAELETEKPAIFEAALFEPSPLPPRATAYVKRSKKGKARVGRSGRSLVAIHRPAPRRSRRPDPPKNGLLSSVLSWLTG